MIRSALRHVRTAVGSQLRKFRATAVSAGARIWGFYGADVRVVRTYRFRGLTFRIALSNADEKGRWDLMVAGRKEPETIRWIDVEFRAGEVFVDVGACIGNYSLYAALRHKGLKVFAFEPEPNSLIQLVKNAQLNDLDITCFLLPLRERAGVDFLNIKDFFASKSKHQFGRTAEWQLGGVAPAARIGLGSSSLDELVREKVIPVPNHAKIDVDGLEVAIVHGMREVLRYSALRTVLCEAGSEREAKEIEELFSEAGFACARRPPADRGNYIFKRRTR